MNEFEHTFDLFISFDYKNLKIAKRLFTKLASTSELKIWSLDDSNEDYQKVSTPSRKQLYQHGIEASKVFLCCLTDDFIDSIRFKKHWLDACLHKKPSVCLMLQKIQTHKLIHLQNVSNIVKIVKCYKDSVNLNKMRGKYFEKLVLHLKSFLITDKIAEDFSLKLFKRNPFKEAYEWNEHGVMVFKSGNMKHSLDCFQKAVFFNPSEKTYLKNKAVALFKLKRYGDAIETINKALELDSSCKSSLSFKASCLNMKAIYEDDFFQNYKAAISALDNAIQLNPEEKIFYANKAGILNKLGLFDQAIEEASKALLIDSSYITARRQKGIALNELGIRFMRHNNFEDALLYFSGALAYDPNCKTFLKNKKIALLKLDIGN